SRPQYAKPPRGRQACSADRELDRHRIRLDISHDVDHAQRHRTSGLVAHLPAHVGEEFPFGGGEAFDTTRRDLVEHAVDLRLCRIARWATWLEAGVSGPGDPARMRSEEHTSELQSR